MKVVLQKDVESVGGAGDIKNVADGFARNFLIPNGLAEPATPESIAKAEEAKKEQTEKEKEDLAKAQEIAEDLDGREVVIKSKAEDDKLFGSVVAKEIVEALAAQGVKLEEKYIILVDPIKEIGEHKIKINLDHGIEVEIKVIVEAE